MKDYIYLDNDLLNSTLAQFEEGLTTNISSGKHNEHTTTVENGKSVSKGLDGILNVGAKLVHEAVEANGQELTKGQAETIDYVLNDYAVDLLISKIENFNTYKTQPIDAVEGNFLNYETSFKIYDFDLIKKITNPDNLNIFKEELSKNDAQELKELRNQLSIIRTKQSKLTQQQKKEIKELESQIQEAQNGGALKGFKTIYEGTKFAEQIFENSILVKSSNAISICKRECFRLNQVQLSFLSETTRKIRVFGIINAIKEQTHSKGDFKELDTDELNKIPSMFHDLFLSNFNMLSDEDRIIKPIAIFFE
ncbi:DUF6414 family protein [Enterococcus faecalis]|uniref:DUF6414 family protein n=1 Tax=Enterococcus faecalis TaxID=1351 RepID=UPI001891CCF1|nr:hypothetical protein [Enterococcus faecalis]QPB60530.1 hypothetical protein GFB65_10850 [Enterococcus faecalis]